MWKQYGDLTIRDAGADDAPQLVRWWNDGTVMAHAGFPNGLGTTEEKVIRQLAMDRDDTGRRLIILLGERPIGEMSYRRISSDACEIGIKICEAEEQNQGRGRICLSLLIEALFHDFGYRRICLDTNLSNRRAQHVYESLGFVRLRVNKDSWVDQVGQPQSSVDYELTEDRFVSWLQAEGR